jgi:glycosyltransferase involved in cell wall biosynthesis
VDRPLVSVLTPVYQGERFVAATVESVLAQTYERVEHVVVDDCSTDGTPEILADFAQRHPERVRVLRHESRAGPCRRRNEGLGIARGELIAWLDHDDLWLPEKLERQVEALEADPGAALAFTQYEEFDHETGDMTYRSAIPAGGDFLRRLFVQGCFVASSTAVFRRATMMQRACRFRETDFSFGDDYFLWLTLLVDARAVLVDEVLVRLRRHTDNESARLGQTNSELRALRLLEEFLEEVPEAQPRLDDVRSRGLARHWAAAAEWELTRGSRRRAAAYALRAASLDPHGAAVFARDHAARAPGSMLRRVRRGRIPGGDARAAA